MRKIDFKTGRLYTLTRSSIFEVPLEERVPHAIGISGELKMVTNKNKTASYYTTDLYDKNGSIIVSDTPIVRLRLPRPEEIEFFNNGGTKFGSPLTKSLY
jgi:hypothetical protein